jgi:protein-S-isoprenylcysteine O-methyltransferase Ste14
VKASAFEFRHRSLIITAIFVLSFSLYALGDQSVVLTLLDWLKRWPSVPPAGAARALFGLGALLALLNAIIRSWAAAYLDTRVVHDRELHSTRLVADGPYRHVRNPLYLGSLLLAFAFVPLTSRFGGPLLIGGMTAFVYRLIEREEAELLDSQGERFRSYCAAVPRMVPSVVPRLPASDSRPRWLQGLVGEAMMWGFFAALAGFALTLDPRIYGFGVAFALLSSVIVKAVVRHESARGPAPATATPRQATTGDTQP